MTTPKIPMVGRTFGLLTVLEQAEPLAQGSREAWYRCACTCGGETTTRGSSLRRGTTRSCGCLRQEETRRRNRKKAARDFDLTGRRFHRLLVIEATDLRYHGQQVWRCRCDCGGEKLAPAHFLASGQVKSCGCLPTRSPDDLTGRRFGRLTVLSPLEERGANGGAVWLCHCACGSQCRVPAGNLKQGRTVSCGCVRREDLTGRCFGSLTVVSLGDRSGAGQGAFWNCRCDCGQETQVSAQKLKGGHTRSCGCAHREQVRDLTGQRFGKLTVVGDSGRRRAGQGGVLWTCRCDCGQEKVVRQDALTGGRTTSCGCVTSRGNETIARLLRQEGIAFQPEYSPDDLEGRRRFDFAVFQGERLAYCIEYDGVLHFTYSGKGWDTEERYERTKQADRIKNAYCAQKGIPLLRIPYTHYEALTLEDLLLETSPFAVNPAGEGPDEKKGSP